MNKILIFLSFTVLLACSGFKSEKQSVNLLITEYDSLLLELKSFDIKSAAPNLKRYNKVIELSKSKMKKDVLPKIETMNYLNDLKLMRRQFKNAPKIKTQLVSKINANKEQLSNLIVDIDGSVFDQTQLQGILSEEVNELKSIKKSLIDFKTAYTVSESRFDSLYLLSNAFNFQ